VQNMLQSFLDAGMLNMVEEDEKFKHLQNTAQDIAAKPPKLKTDVINYTLVALDPEASPQEPVFEKVETSLKKHWQTFRAKFPDVPRQILRAIIFETLRIRGEKDIATAAIIWWTGANYLPYATLGREREVCRAFLSGMGDITEKQAVEEWTSNYEYSTPEFPPFKANFKAKGYEINEEALTSHLAAAAGPQDAQGTATGPDPNTIWPNSGQPWSHKFAPRAAKGITEVVNTSLIALFGNIEEVLKQIGVNLGEHTAAMNEVMQGAVNQVAQSAKANERRSQLLWWRQTLYSPTLKESYRKMDRAVATLSMGYDLYTQVTDYHPQSVEYLLRETVRNVTTTDDSEAPNQLTLFEFCQLLQSSDHATELRQTLKASVSGQPGRVSLLSLVKDTLAGESLDANKLIERVGIKSDIPVNLEDLAVWMFRDLQAFHLATQKQ
jgi:hypothetical protein